MLPNTPPGVPPAEPANKTRVNQVLLDGAFNPNISDPNFGADNSFIYFFEFLDVTTQTSYQNLNPARVNTNNNCTTCDSVDISEEVSTGWTNSTTFGLEQGLIFGAPSAQATLETTLSQTFEISQSGSSTITKNFQPNCCSRTRFLKEKFTETKRFIIGWQEDTTFGWNDQGRDLYTTIEESFGLTERTNNGACVVPEPTTILGTIMVLAFGGFLKNQKNKQNLN